MVNARLSRIARLSALLLAVTCCFAQDAKVATGSVAGEVFTAAADGQKEMVPGAQLILRGAVERHTESDAIGRYRFEAVPPGRYTVEASAPGLKGSGPVDVIAGETAAAAIRLELTAVTSSVTVDAAAEPAVATVSTQSAQSTTITQATVETAPTRNDRVENLLPLVPGVVRGPDGRINMKGAQATQAGWLMNSANVTDPATGAQAMVLPIDVVSSVKVISNPYDPEYGKFTGAVSSVETKPGNQDNFHLSVQNFLPRLRVRDSNVVGLESVTPRMTVTGPLVKKRVAITQSLEYRYVRTPVQSLPPMSRDTKLETVDSFTQVDLSLSETNTATVSFAVFPERFQYLGLNTFTPQQSTPDLHQRGYQTSLQDRYILGTGLLTSQFNYQKTDADVFPNSTAPYRLLLETTEGGFFSRQDRQSDRYELQEVYQFGERHFYGTHTLKVGIDLSHSSYDGRQAFSPTDIVGAAGYPVERIEFGAPTRFSVHQNEFAGFVGDQWRPWRRVSLDLGLRFDHDTVTDSRHGAPRAGVTVALTRDDKTLLKAGGGFFYDRVPLNIPSFSDLPERTVFTLGSQGNVVASTAYVNALSRPIRNPRSTAWNIELDRQVLSNLAVRVAYQSRYTGNAFAVNPSGQSLIVSNGGRDSYREFQVTGVYRVHGSTVNASYVKSRAFGDLNDFNQFFGNNPVAVIQPNVRARLPFDAPNRYLFWGEIAGPKKITVVPVLDLHTGFPYSIENEAREFVGPRNVERFPWFASLDVQMMKEVRLPLFRKERKAKVGVGVYNLLNRFDPRDVQNNLDSYRFGSFFNSVPRTFRGKFVLGF